MENLKKLEGYIFYPQLVDIENFDVSEALAKKEYYDPLKNGILRDMPESKSQQLKIDIKGHTHDGYIKGFLYPDKNQFLGKLYYNNNAQPVDTYTGKYEYKNDGLEIKGSLDVGGKNGYGFCMSIF